MIDASTVALIEQLAARAAASQEPAEARVAASLSGALPVHRGMGGVLLLRADGEVLLYDYESETCEPAATHPGAPTPT